MFSRFLLIPCALLIFSSPAWAGEDSTRFDARAEVNWRYGQDRGILMSEFWVPIMQDDGSVFYGDLRMMGDNQDNREGNLGFGYRNITSLPILGDGVAGVHGWFDRRITARGSNFNQITIGGEWLGTRFDVLANGYIPLSDERTITIPNANPQGAALVGTGIVIDTDGSVVEEPQHGFDIELGLELGSQSDFIKAHTDSVRLYGGGYYFDGDKTDKVAGWRARVAADISSDIQVGMRFQRDPVRGSQGFLEATVRFPFGQKKSYRKEGLRARLDESPERDIDIVTNEVVTDSGDRVAVLNATTGTAQEVLHVDNTAGGGGDGSAESPFNTLAAAEAAASAQSIIYVSRGDGTSANQNAGITLNKTGQQLIGSGTNFVYDSGRFTTANGQSPSAFVIASAGAAPVIGNINAGQDGVKINADNITVAGVIVDNANTGRDGIVVEADGGAASAQNVTITDVTTQNNRFGIYVHGTNGGSVSAKVQNAVATTNSQHGVAIYDDTSGTFTADLGGGSMGSAGNNVLAGNTLEDLAVDLDGATLTAKNNWWGQATGADTDDPSVGIAPQIYYGAPINDGLVGHWTFDTEWTSNTIAYDRSGNGNNGALQGGLSLADSVTGVNGEALNFDGGNFFVEIPDNPSLNPSNAITILYNFSTSTPGGTLWKGGGWNTHGYSAWHIAGNTVRVELTNSGTEHSTRDTTVPTSVLNHFAVTWNIGDGIVRPYLEGVASATTGHSTVIGTDTRSLFFGQIDPSGGAAPNGAARWYEGVLDDVHIYNRALSSAEISELHRMNTSSGVDTSGFLTATP